MSRRSAGILALLPLFAMLTLAASAQSAPPTPAPLSAKTIMARVAANQDRTQAERLHYVYLQHVRTTSRKPGGRLMCEEITDSRVTPEQAKSHHQLIALQGSYWRQHQYLTYAQLPKDDDRSGMDRDLVENLRSNLTDEGSKDGLATGLFPLTTQEQAKYTFTLLGRDRMNGRDVYHLRFLPTQKDEYAWKGDAFIDTQDFQPVVVYTRLSRKLPILVRTLLGTNLPGLGFTVTYARQPDGLWFPTSFGTEFRMRVVFFIVRDLSISLDNSHFEKTHADARVLDGFTPAPAPAHP